MKMMLMLMMRMKRVMKKIFDYEVIIIKNKKLNKLLYVYNKYYDSIIMYINIYY